MFPVKSLLSVRTVLPLLLPVLAACTSVTNPATGQKEWSAVTPEQEKAIGREQHPKMLAQFGGAYADGNKGRDLGFYVSRLGANLARHSELPAGHFTFTLIDSPIVNAFALPGGYVYISRGLMALANDEAELAGVLAHEIGHVTARHTAQRITNAQRGQALSVGAAILGSIAGVRGVGQAANQAAALTLQSWSREQELEADRLAIRYMLRAGYDPRAMVTFLENMQAEQEIQARLQKRPGEAEAWNLMSTHPRTGDRIQKAIAAVTRSGADLPTRRNRNGYLNTIDGMTYGDSAKQGFVRGTEFFHPEIGFTFELPEGWIIQNSPQAIIGRNEAGHFFRFDMGSSEGRGPAYNLRKLLNSQNPPGLETDRTSIGARAYARKGVRLGRKNGVALVSVTTDQEGRAWRMTFAKPGEISRRQQDEWLNSMDSLRRLYTDEVEDLQAWEIDVVEVRDQRHLNRLLRRSPLQPDARERLRVLNGGDALRPGRVIKTITE